MRRRAEIRGGESAGRSTGRAQLAGALRDATLGFHRIGLPDGMPGATSR